MKASVVPELGDPRDYVRYTLAGAAFLLRVPSSTIRGWANGYTKELKYGGPVKVRPILQTDRSDPMMFSFHEIIELLYVKVLTASKNKDGTKKRPLATLDDVRRIAQNMSLVMGEPFPLARSNLKSVLGELSTDRVLSGQLTNPVVLQHFLEFADELLVDLEFADSLAITWFPVADHTVRVDPRFRFGQPIVASGNTTQSIYERFLLEDRDEEDTAEWFDISVDLVRNAKRFEEEWRSKPLAAA